MGNSSTNLHHDRGAGVHSVDESETVNEMHSRMSDCGVRDAVNCEFVWPYGGNEVFLAGSFNNWNERVHMVRSSSSSGHTAGLWLLPGEYQYKFVVDGEWATDNAKVMKRDPDGNMNNVVLVVEQHSAENYSSSVPENSVASDQSPRLPHRLPPQLRMSILNSNHDPLSSPSHRVPPRVTLNHLFSFDNGASFSEQHQCSLYGVSQRYLSKFVTLLYVTD